FEGERLDRAALHRFENNLIGDGALFRWDAGALFQELKQGFRAYAAAGGRALASFGVDTWGVDYGLLDAEGALLENPRAYRCAVDGDMARVWEKIPKRTLFERTGLAAMNFNTLYQLYRRRCEGDAALERARTLLLMPDLMGYLFTGDRLTEYTAASTTNLLDPRTRGWDRWILETLGLPADIFTPVDLAGSLRGRIRPSLAAELGAGQAVLAAVGGHDTASAVAAIPGKGSFAFCSSGTWSLFGVETDEPVLTEAVYRANFSNEGSVQGGFRPLKNIMGLWLIQECRREWTAEGRALSWDEIVRLAMREPAFRSIVDPDDAPFFSAGGMRDKIRAYCRQTGQPQPETVGQFARCVYESLALKYRYALETLEGIKGARIDSLNIVGGGIQNRLLNQMAADATERPVITGPVEGACAGNLLMQAQALGEIGGVEEAREVVRRSFEPEYFMPQEPEPWREAYGRLLGYMKEEGA
ncbi:MAG: rhamnulokinase family protein, partial [Clostridia bacterium]|nr:rhamnulokinase family protein [Clostridia bacterium]